MIVRELLPMRAWRRDGCMNEGCVAVRRVFARRYVGIGRGVRRGVFTVVPWGSCYCAGSRRRTGENDGMRSVREVALNRSGKGGG